ncbi:protein-tyrosine phosphatase family protein [uncultured Parvibaculum sp.]|uniref:tyrosine phosphatase family protein n=1 Tax=uncultured Parvibaculum sp. TaxID=291828 RepID=UPI0030DB0BC0|tara:strand:+ start:28268 stop:28786 length:519 start_codon:yes stop_codon:yes gene_type:complete
MIYVSPLSAVADAIESVRPSHLVSLLDPETMIGTPRGIEPARHLRLGVNDIAAPLDDLVPPGIAHVSALIEFVRGWDQQNPLLVHCWAGISRSSAAAFIALCTLNEDHPEADLARLVRARGAHAHPNRLMVQVADELLARQGRMSAAVEALGPGRAVWEGEIFSVPIRPYTD